MDQEFRTKRIRRLNDALRQGKAEFASVLLTVAAAALFQGLVMLPLAAAQSLSATPAPADTPARSA